MYRTPSRYSESSFSSEFSIACPPSTPMSTAMWPRAAAARTSPAVVASSTSRLLSARARPDREERGREPPLAHARHVDVAVRQPRGNVRLHVEHALRRVDVAVHDDGLLEHEQ